MQKIKMYHQKDNCRLLCLRIDYHKEYEHIPMLKHILINEQILHRNRGICSIFHLQRNKLHENTADVFFNNWSTIMIDNLQEHKIIPRDILIQPSYRDLVIHLQFLTFEHILNDHINRCFMKFRYQVTNKNYESNVNERLESILLQLTSITTITNNNHLSLRSLIQTQLLDMIKNIDYNPSNIQFND